MPGLLSSYPGGSSKSVPELAFRTSTHMGIYNILQSSIEKYKLLFYIALQIFFISKTS